jgi:drug/metabolite transporter (DMT)-like permease
MLRGAVIIFTGITSMLILKKYLKAVQWGGMFVVLLGLLCVGAAAFFGGNSSAAKNQMLGDVLIIGAQVIVAFQMVVEEKLIKAGSKIPALQAVGLEGFFGCIYITIICVGFNFTPGPRAGHHFEDAADAFAQIANSLRIVLALCGTILSIALFNYSGLSVTKEMSSTTRMVLDSLRTIVIWVFGLLATDSHTGSKQHWEEFNPKGPGFLQLAGFVLLLTGSALYNEREVTGKDGKPIEDQRTGEPLKEPLLFPLLRVFGCIGPVNHATIQSEKQALLGKQGSVNQYE